MTRILLLIASVALVVVVTCSLSFGQTQKALAVVHPFEPVEELFYEAEFNRTLLRGLNVAEFKLRSERTPINAKPTATAERLYTLAFSADVASKGFFTKLFNLKFREQIQSTVDASNFTIQKSTMLDEQGKRVRTSETLYDRSKGKLSWTQRDPNNPNVEPRTAVVDFTGQLQDVLSAIYFLRTQKLEAGKTFEVFVSDSGHVYRVPIHVFEKKKMKTVIGKVSVIRLEPDLFGPEGMLDDEKGQFTIWITDDEKHIPVSARVKTEYGTFDIKLKRVVYNPAG
jgi:hypothetical protein